MLSADADLDVELEELEASPLLEELEDEEEADDVDDESGRDDDRSGLMGAASISTPSSPARSSSNGGKMRGLFGADAGNSKAARINGGTVPLDIALSRRLHPVAVG